MDIRGMAKITINALCRRNLIYRFHNGLLVILLMSFWLMFHPLSFSTFTKQSQRDIVEENVNVSNAIILSMVPQAYHKYLVSKTKNSTLPTRAVNVSASKAQFQQALSIAEIQHRISEYNKLQTVLNEDTFGPLQNDSLVIVIQVHNRLMYLRHIISSLTQTKGIENALLVFSHDYLDEEINYLVQSIDFCKVMQIFYPFSIQTHPNEFPGESENDCPRNIGMKEAIQRKCSNALHPDLYGHYREAKFTQIKHHWWWKANRIFNGLNITKNYTGLVVFFEEDHYVAQDFIHMLHLMEHARQSSCPTCKILSLESYIKTVDFSADSKKVGIMQWSNRINNMGMAFNRTVWQELKGCAKTFCTYDDYNWDWSLLAVSSECLLHGLTAMVLRAPRVFHIGECGVHHKNSCKSTATLRRVQRLLQTSSAYLYPQDLYLTYIATKKYLKKAKGNGGWGDVRDHNLCLKMVEGSK